MPHSRYQIDDPVSAGPTHLFCGTWGAVAAGLFATQQGIYRTYHVWPSSWGLFYGGGGWQLLVQVGGGAGSEAGMQAGRDVKGTLI